MDARTYLKELKDDGWYLGSAEGACRQYIHRDRDGIITVCVRHNDEFGPETEASSKAPAEADVDRMPEVAIETTRTGASAYCPDLPGVIATGPDEVSTRERMSGAIALHRRGLSGS